MRGDKRASIQWTVGKLLTIILLIVLLVLVIWGFSWGGMRPLMNTIETKTNEVLILLNIKHDVPTGEVECVDRGAYTIPGTNLSGELRECARGCVFTMATALSNPLANRFAAIGDGRLGSGYGSQLMVNDKYTIATLDNPDKMGKDYDAFFRLKDKLNYAVAVAKGLSPDTWPAEADRASMMANRSLRIYFKSEYSDWLFRDRVDHIMYNGGEWFLLDKTEWKKKNVATADIIEELGRKDEGVEYDVYFIGEKSIFGKEEYTSYGASVDVIPESVSELTGVWVDPIDVRSPEKLAGVVGELTGGWDGTLKGEESISRFISDQEAKFQQELASQKAAAENFISVIEGVVNGDPGTEEYRDELFFDFGGNMEEFKLRVENNGQLFAYFDVTGTGKSYGLTYVDDPRGEPCLFEADSSTYAWAPATDCRLLRIEKKKFDDRVSANRIFLELYRCAK